MRQLAMVHRTNYQGDDLEARSVFKDTVGNIVSFKQGPPRAYVLWVQLTKPDGSCSCPSFGDRSITITRAAMFECYDGSWVLYRAGDNPGRVKGHLFRHFVLTPAGHLEGPPKYWQRIGDGSFQLKLSDIIREQRSGEPVMPLWLEALLAPYREHASYAFCHVHVALHLPQPLDLSSSEDASSSSSSSAGDQLVALMGGLAVGH